MKANTSPYERAVRSKIAKANDPESLRLAKLAIDSLRNHGSLSGEECMRLKRELSIKAERVESVK